MNAYDPDLHEPQRGLDAIEARLAQHQQTTRTILLFFVVLAALALALIINYIPACATMAERLLKLVL
jgi:hypothetical protein